LCWLSRYDAGGRFIDVVRRRAPGARIVFDPVDLHWLRQWREATLAGDRVGMFQAMAVREREMYVVRMSEVTAVVSRVEEDILRKDVPGASVVWMPIPHEVPGRTRGFADRDGIAFVGNFLHRPNVDSVTFFLDDVWPLIRRVAPAMRFYVVGPEMPEVLARRQDEGVQLVGHVPDLDGWLERVRLTVAPLRFGAGAKGKVITSLANGVPCVATRIAAEGLGVTDEEVAVAESPEEMAATIIRIHDDASTWLAMSDAAVEWARSTHSMEAAREGFDEIVGSEPRTDVSPRTVAA
jgi:glycosyltransferase involved in cell wall biosynthesis